MLFWAIYFILVTYLQIFGFISAHAFYNLFLCLFVFFPLPGKLPKKILIDRVRFILGIILGIVLLWHESYLPSLNTIWQFLTDPSLRPSPVFIYRYLLSVFSIKLLLFFLITLVWAYLIARTRLKKYFGIFFIICFLILGFTEKPSTSTDLIGEFYKNEATRTVSFANDPNNDYDIVILQLCSFSWSDFSYVNYDLKPFFKNFDYVFTDFNSATSYSNPAALRLLESTCGQSSHEQLFTDRPSSCYLMDVLKKAGYSTYVTLNHNGTYSGFNDAISRFGKAPLALDNSKLNPIELSFDNEPVYSDGDALSLWLKTREREQNNKAVLFYNSITLHTGSHYVDSTFLPDNSEYKFALGKITAELNNFFAEIKKSNRKTIVIVVGEHGAALQGSTLQPSTVREIPLPEITQVPAAIKIFGPGFNDQASGEGILIDRPMSYLGLLELVSRIIKEKPENQIQLVSKKIENKLPETNLVSDNENGTIMQSNLSLFYKLKKYKTWDYLPGSLMVKPTNYLSN